MRTRVSEAYNERDAMVKGYGVWFTDLLCTFQDSTSIYLVMEFMQGVPVCREQPVKKERDRERKTERERERERKKEKKERKKER